MTAQRTEPHPTPAEELPVARVLKMFPKVVNPRTGNVRSYRTVLVRCPFCAAKHTHGWPDSWEEPGMRIPHCNGPKPSAYYIPKPEAA
jgi:hypothetical protein